MANQTIKIIPYTITGWWYTYPPEKYEFVNGKDDVPYMKWKNKQFMFETTNQNIIPVFTVFR